MANIEQTTRRTAGDVLRHHIAEGNTSTEQIARVLSASTRTVYRIVNGEAHLSFDHACILAARLQQVVADDLVALMPNREASRKTLEELDTNGDRKLDPADVRCYAIRAMKGLMENMQSLNDAGSKVQLWGNQFEEHDRLCVRVVSAVNDSREVAKRMTVLPRVA